MNIESLQNIHIMPSSSKIDHLRLCSSKSKGWSSIGARSKSSNPSTRGIDVFTLSKSAIRFIRSEEDDLNPSWEQKLVKRYYDKLFKEYCIADMSQYKSGKIGLRWRTEKEVLSGKGQFICGNKHCNEKDGLASYEVNFSYFEAGEDKQALVKLVTCERCAEKLLYKKMKEKEQLRKREKEELLKKRERSESGDGTDTGYGRSKERKKGRVASASASDHKSKSDDDENFNEFLEGMFP